MESEKRLYQPQEFADIVGITKRALRYYNQQGILKPYCTNESGHHFYSEDSFFDVQQIITLRFLQFSIEEIKEIQEQDVGVKRSLQMQRQMLLEKKKQIQSMIEAINNMETDVNESEKPDWNRMFEEVKAAKCQMVYDSMKEYYDARADEYDEIYQGKGPASFAAPLYKEDVTAIFRFMESFGRGRTIDIGSGSGYWLKGYASRCLQLTCIDYSKRMLARCKAEVKALGIEEKAVLMEEDFLTYEFEQKAYFDCAVAGFLLGHMTGKKEQQFFERLKKIGKQKLELLVIENTWSKARAKTQKKEDISIRQLDDGRIFKIYKRYFEKNELRELLQKYGFEVKEQFWGNTFTAVRAEYQAHK